MIVTFSFADLNGVKSLIRLGSTLNDTFLSMLAFAVTDSSGNAFIEVPSNDALQAGDLVPDDMRPTLNFFVLDLNQATLTLTFSETIDVARINPSGITLQNTDGENITESLTLTSGVLATTQNSDIIRIGILDSDFTLLTQLIDLGTFVNNTYISVLATAFGDTSGNRLIPIPSTNALEASDIIPDTRAPVLVAYDFSLNTETITLTFSEAVDVSTLDPTQLTIQQNRNASEGGLVLQLTGGSANFVTPQIVEVSLALQDVRFLKTSGVLGSSAETTYVSINSSFIMDYSDNFAIEVTSDVAIRTMRYSPDTSSPRIIRFDLDLMNETVTVEFDELIDPTSPNISNVFFTDAPSLANATVIVPLLTSSLTVLDNFTVNIQLSTSDLNAMKSIPGFGFDNSTYIYLNSNTVVDIYGIPFAPQIFEVSGITEDTMSPSLLSFSVNLNTSELLLTFTETVDPTSLDVSAITLLNNAVPANSDQQVILQDSVSTSSPSPVLVISLGPLDATNLQAMMNLATVRMNTFISLLRGAVADVYGNPNLPIIMPEMASDLISDLSRPVLRSFDLDFNSNQLILSFSETLNVNTFDITAITLQNRLSMATVTLPLSSGTFSRENARVIELALSPDDLETLQFNPEIGTTPSNTFLSLAAASVFDLNGFNATPIFATSALRATTVIADNSPPQVRSFEYNLFNNSITVLFTEPVNATTFNLELITLFNARMNATRNYTLTGGDIVQETPDSITITRNNLDELTLDSFVDLCTTHDNCFLTSEPGPCGR